tara:strand:+ start:1610 stop:1855 length:246 start_codon:yes stop_codon:yes gene_type:complete
MSVRKRIALNPAILEMLEEYKENIQWHATKGRVPLSWNDFFVILISDWENGRAKCKCGSFHDCHACHSEKALEILRQGGQI